MRNSLFEFSPRIVHLITISTIRTQDVILRQSEQNRHSIRALNLPTTARSRFNDTVYPQASHLETIPHLYGAKYLQLTTRHFHRHPESSSKIETNQYRLAGARPSLPSAWQIQDYRNDRYAIRFASLYGSLLEC